MSDSQIKEILRGLAGVNKFRYADIANAALYEIERLEAELVASRSVNEKLNEEHCDLAEKLAVVTLTHQEIELKKLMIDRATVHRATPYCACRSCDSQRSE